MDQTQFQESRKSARLPSQRSLEEDNILGMLAVMAGYINQKDPAFMEAISTNRTESILNRFVYRKLIKKYQAEAIKAALAETSFVDSEKFGALFCNKYGNENLKNIELACQVQKTRKGEPKEFIGQILLELGHANMNQIIEILKIQENERSQNNQDLLSRIKILEKTLKPTPIVYFRQEFPEAFWILSSFILVSGLLLCYYLLF